ncbi:MAG: DUF86 domain-containing protein [Planctomycetia bacterium]|nr:DUF86 domain-containing protein [Planctomycetia bacterium]
MPTPPDDILLNKAAVIERCIRRIREEAASSPLFDDFTHVDALTLNIERACQAAIDMAMHVVAERHLGVPQSMADAFVLLERTGSIEASLSASLQGMVGFRNVAVHQYEEMDMGVLRWVVESGHRDWIRLGKALGVSIQP